MAFLETRVPQPFTNPSGLLEVPDTAGAVIDLNADTITATNGEAVTSWASTGTNPLVLNEAKGSRSFPLLRQGVVNGRNAVDFLGNHNIASVSEMVLDAGEPSTYVMVIKSRSTGRILSGYPASANFRAVTHSGDSITVLSEQPDHVARSRTIAVDSPGEWHVLIARWSGDGTMTLLTSEGKREDVNSGIGQALGVVIGGTSAGATPFDGQVARLMMYDRGLSDTDCQALLGKLRSDYGV